jgi:peptidoglycan/LPS O-acetylase OafA/YrhL
MNIQKKMYILFFSVILSFFMLYCLYPAIEFYIHGYKKLLVSIITLLFCYYVCFKFIISIHSYARVDKVETINFQRLIGMDIIRCVACVLVILVHFIISIGWYNQAPEGGEWFVVAIIRWLAQCCCPLFMILSGYFLSNRTAGIKHLNGLIHFIRNYAFLCIMCVLVNRDYSYESIKNLINLSHYWYIDMYFGLFLLVPFLNILWKYATNQEKNLLVCVLIFLSSVGTVTNHLKWFTCQDKKSDVL